MNKRNEGIWIGILIMSGVRSLSMDMMGLEKYKASVEVGWVSPWYSVPGAIVCILIAVGLLVMGVKDDIREANKKG